MRRTAHTTRDHPTIPGAAQLDMQEGVEEWATVDREVLDAVRAVGVWSLMWSLNADGTRRPSAVYHQFRHPDGRQRPVNLGAFVLELYDGPRGHDKLQPDHLNNDVFDNRRVNLEWVTPAENVRRALERKAARA